MRPASRGAYSEGKRKGGEGWREKKKWGEEKRPLRSDPPNQDDACVERHAQRVVDDKYARATSTASRSPLGGEISGESRTAVFMGIEIPQIRTRVETLARCTTRSTESRSKSTRKTHLSLSPGIVTIGSKKRGS